MKRTTTPLIEFELPFDYDKLVSKFIISFSQQGKLIVQKTEQDDGVKTNGNVISFKLTQEETALFNVGVIRVEIKILTLGNDVIASDIIHTTVEEVLNDKVFL